jgi:low affinity Fe/Cu permease
MKKHPIEVQTRTTNDWFGRFAASASGWLGSRWAFAGAGLVIVVWPRSVDLPLLRYIATRR